MQKRLLVSAILICIAHTVWAKSRIHPKILFTWLAIGSTVIVLGMWIVFWNRRKR